MLQDFHHIFQEIREDKPYFWLLLTISIVGVVYIFFSALLVHSSATQLIDQYSGLGITHFYRGKWYALYEFSLYGLIVTALSIVLLAKLKGAERRHLGIVFGWITLAILCLSFIYTLQVIHLAYL